MKITAIVLTKNEEENVARCLKSLEWLPEVIVADSHSRDKTVEIVNTYKNTKLIDTDWLGFSETKSLAISHASNDWILWIDADEECTPELIIEISNLALNQAAYKIRRSNFFMGERVHFSGWRNDWVTRLFNKNKCKFDGSSVHEKLLVDGECIKLSSLLNHYTYKNFAHYMQKFDEYTWLGAHNRLAKTKSIGIYHLLIRPKARFIRHYFLQLGFLDGKVGLIISLLSAYNVFIRNLKIQKLLDGESDGITKK
jgi:glycosyltransferase involved in cell wall biosynthesis